MATSWSVSYSLKDSSFGKRDASPVLDSMNRCISRWYPATITTQSSRWSSISFRMVATASRPKSPGLFSGNRV